MTEYANGSAYGEDMGFDYTWSRVGAVGVTSVYFAPGRAGVGPMVFVWSEPQGVPCGTNDVTVSVSGALAGA